MAAGTYRLYIHDPQDVYAATYYPDATDIEEANDVVVSGSPVTAVDTQIAAGGQITGTLSWPDGPSPINSSLDGTCLRTISKISIVSVTRFTGRKFDK